jgi:hypothetical protein
LVHFRIHPENAARRLLHHNAHDEAAHLESNLANRTTQFIYMLDTMMHDHGVGQQAGPHGEELRVLLLRSILQSAGMDSCSQPTAQPPATAALGASLLTGRSPVASRSVRLDKLLDHGTAVSMRIRFSRNDGRELRDRLLSGREGSSIRTAKCSSASFTTASTAARHGV